MLNSFWENVKGKKLESDALILKTRVKKWVAKADNVKQAKPFEREELSVLYERPMEPHKAHFAPFAGPSYTWASAWLRDKVAMCGRYKGSENKRRKS